MTPPQTVLALGRHGQNSQSRSTELLLQKPWARAVIPSLSDLFFLAVLVWLFVSSGAAGWSGLLADADVGWHIRTGEYILDHHAVPRQDLYSFSKPGAPWYAWEWGADLLDGGLHRIFGLKGVVLLAAVLIALFATTLIRRMTWRNVHPFVALIVALLAVGGSLDPLPCPSARLHALVPLRFGVGGRIRPPHVRVTASGGLVPLTVVWTNLHGGFLALIALLALTSIGVAIEAYLDMERLHGAYRYAKLTAACALASLVNPYGIKLHIHVWDYLRSDWIRSVIQEFQAPSFRNENLLQYEVLLLVGLIVAGVLFRRKQVAEGLWILFFAHMSLNSVRHVPIFVTIAAPLIAMEVAAWWGIWSARASRTSVVGTLNQIAADAAPGFRRTSLWPVAVVLALIVIGSPLPWPKDFPEVNFPVKIVHAHEKEIMTSRVLTTDQWADYLIYTDPRSKVFVDGRSDFYGEEIGNQYLRMYGGSWDWSKLMKQYRFNLVLLPVESPLVQLLKITPEWRVEQDNGKEILLVHR